VAGIGIQVLFGFLLSLPFSSRFTHLDDALRHLYIVSPVLAALATGLLTGPVAYHRLVFRQHKKARQLRVAKEWQWPDWLWWGRTSQRPCCS
jgi:hypothetical protein